MAGEVTRDEFDHLRTRVDIVEREVEGEKLVTRHILEQTRRNGDDLATIKTRLGRLEGKVDGVDQKVDFIEQRLSQKIDAVAQDLTGLRGTVHGLAANLPGIVANAVREGLRDRKTK